jgi:hypothetical protein
MNARRLGLRSLRLSVLALIAPIRLLALFCENSHRVDYRNATEQEVTVFVGDDEPFSLNPGESRGFGELKFSGTKLFLAKTGDGQTVYSQDLTWNQLRDRDWTVEIRQNQ